MVAMIANHACSGLTNTLVTLSDEFSDVYWGTADSRQFPKAQNFDTTAAYFRTHYILAATISHELCHCIHYITHGKTEMEPFYEDHRISELGMAFEAAIWGDCWYIQGQNARLDADGNYMASITCPYGVSMAEWPAGLPDSMLGTGYAIATAAFRGAKSTQFFPMLTAELWTHLTQDFWSRTVPSRGLHAFRWTRDIGVVCEADPNRAPYEVGPSLNREPARRPVPTDDALRARGFKLKTNGHVNSEDSGVDSP